MFVPEPAAPVAPSDEGSLIRAARGGDVRAYAVLVARHQPLAYRTACLIAAPADAADATQAAFIKAFAALGRFRPGAPFRPWLLRIVVNEACSAHRAGLRHRRLAARVVEQPQLRLEPSPEETLLVREESKMLARALAGLTPKHRDVVTCPAAARTLGGGDIGRPRHPVRNRQVPSFSGARPLARRARRARRSDNAS
jgi:RNA polymerase sigma-70 factor (ECF subfamily)